MESVEEVMAWWGFGECWGSDGRTVVGIYGGWVDVCFVHDKFCGEERAAGLAFVDCVMIDGTKYVV